MNGYIALKTITLSGVVYNAGDSIPAGAILPNRVHSLLASGTIAEQKLISATQNAQQSDFTDEVISLPIVTENGVQGLSVGSDDICKAIEIMQLKADDAVSAIKEVSSDDVCILLNACDSRSAVKKAAKAQAAEIAKLSAEDDA